MSDEKNLIGAEFQALPLDFMIAAPLVAAVKAQRVAAETTRDYIQSMIDKDGKPLTVDFSVQKVNGGANNSIDVKAPLLAMVPVPHLQIQSLDIHFTFEVSETFRDSSETSKGVEINAQTGSLLSPWVSASIKGNASSKSSTESSTNRHGQLDVTVHATESAIPEGLARVLSLMTSAIQTPDSTTPPT
ncbi:hypothetical protein BTA51_02410 [Hahella sp. CCB-MM4]|uniref:DUF2589 domain-containing protein n=1 Tax=Hahella sp. (strain CCB-MM4) TaxID=1926491 RepID=UPI000B9B38FE|nr:DUF2589 domain-containing protein [Hahella sp. CCB-MM4]OZG75257.1 hypothetical protein BTA51_02410 [Hahella sp. CCB-MM4]